MAWDFPIIFLLLINVAQRLRLMRDLLVILICEHHNRCMASTLSIKIARLIFVRDKLFDLIDIVSARMEDEKGKANEGKR